MQDGNWRGRNWEVSARLFARTRPYWIRLQSYHEKHRSTRRNRHLEAFGLWLSWVIPGVGQVVCAAHTPSLTPTIDWSLKSGKDLERPGMPYPPGSVRVRLGIPQVKMMVNDSSPVDGTIHVKLAAWSDCVLTLQQFSFLYDMYRRSPSYFLLSLHPALLTRTSVYRSELSYPHQAQSGQEYLLKSLQHLASTTR